MILRFERKLIGLGNYYYKLSSNNQVLGQVIFQPAQFGHVNLLGDFESSSLRLMGGGTFGPLQWEGKINRKEAGQFQINGQNGIIYNCGEKGSNFFNGYYFWEFWGQDQVYRAYEVGFGRKGIYYCVWTEDHLAAIISNDMVTRHFQNGYTLYTKEISIEWMALMTLYWDLTRYPPSRSRNKGHTLNTWQKELKNKYDPNFISAIIEDEKKNGYDNTGN